MSGRHIPPLERHCGSWMAIRLSDGAAVLETFSPAVARKVNRRAYHVATAAQWLGAFNAALKAGDSATAGRRALASLCGEAMA
jgi:hypothetical protein